MEEEFNLSSKIFNIDVGNNRGKGRLDRARNSKNKQRLYVKDVKEFIKRLKEEAQWNMSGIIGQSITAELHDLIDKLAGGKLNG